MEPVHELLQKRFSPRVFEDRSVSRETIRKLLEAARWAPSCFNEQPWLFVYGARGDDSSQEFDTVLQILNERNQGWAKNASVLAILFARRTFARNDKPNRWAQFDCGAAWVSLALQARSMGLYAHGMAGFYPDKAYELLNVPEDKYEAMAAIAVGQYGDREALPEPVREMDEPNDRKPLAEVAVKGSLQR